MGEGVGSILWHVVMPLHHPCCTVGYPHFVRKLHPHRLFTTVKIILIITSTNVGGISLPHYLDKIFISYHFGLLQYLLNQFNFTVDNFDYRYLNKYHPFKFPMIVHVDILVLVDHKLHS